MSAGAMLRSAREQAGLHIGALAVSLKVPVSKLEALEADRIDLLPDAVFARALASSICRTLKIDPGPVLQRFPEQATPKLHVGAKVKPSSFHTPSMGWRVPLLSRLSRPTLITVAALLLAALLVWLVPSLDFLKAPSASAPKAGAGGGAQVLPPVRAVDAAPVALAAPGTVASAAPQATSRVAAAPSPAPVSAPAPAPATGSGTAGVGQASADASVVVFKARGPAWVQVTDGAGTVQLRKTLASGETAGASGSMPLSIVVGRIDSTDVLVRGKTFDLAPLSKDNVARFQIK